MDFRFSSPEPQPEPEWRPLPDPRPQWSGENAGWPAPAAYEQPTVLRPAARPPIAWVRIPTTKPVVTLVILAVLVAIYIPMLIYPNIGDTFLTWGEKDNGLIVQGEWWRLITMTLLHGPPIHMFLNGWALFVIGMDLETFMGRGRFAAVYAISGLAGSVASFAFSPEPGIGASGAIFGLVGALGVYYGLNRFLFGKMGTAQFWNIIIVIVLNLGIGFSGFFPIDNSAHLGGLVAGAVIGFVLCPRYTLGEWQSPEVREITNVNRGRTTWLAAGLVALDVVLLFFVVLMLYNRGVIKLFG